VLDAAAVDELVTQIIIHSIKDKPIFHFLNIRKKICGTFQCICDSDAVLLHVSLHDICRVCKNHYIRLCFERHFREPNHPEALCFEGCWRIKLESTYDLQVYGPTPFSPQGFARFLSIREARGSLAFDLAQI
jgi:hypothetical protein